MASLPGNIEKSAFHKGEYVGYDGTGKLWRVRKVSGYAWEAVPAPNHPGYWSASRITKGTLASLAAELASRIHQPPVEPF